MTVLEVLTASSDFLRRKGVESPRLNAEHLLAAELGCKRLDLYLRFDEALSEEVLVKLRQQVRRRGAGEPLQHLLGTIQFLGREFLCDARALVPRPETELLVEKVLARLRATEGPPRRVADVGTGSGVIAISLALELDGWQVAATDISTEALELARENAARHGVAINFIEGPYLDGLCGGGLMATPLGAVVANLPYIPSGEIEGLSVEVRHDPPAALDGGPDGLAAIRELARRSPVSLAPGGLLALEIGAGQADEVTAVLEGENFQDITVESDYQTIERFVFATAPR